MATDNDLRSRIQRLIRDWTPPPSGVGSAPPLGEPPDAGRAIPRPGADRLTLRPRSARAVAVAAVALLALVGWWWWQGRPREPVTAPEVVATGAPVVGADVPGSGSSSPRSAEVVVHVTGPVRHPGIVRLPAGSRVVDAIDRAGGLRPGARLGDVNLARPLVDGEQVVVGPRATAAPAGSSDPSSAAPVDLNAAGPDDLDRLPGVGPVLAARIIEWRDRNGGFRSVEELREVSGIGDSTFAELAPLVRV